jgi:hypothetical protein
MDTTITTETSQVMVLFACLTGCRRTSDGTNVACLLTSRHALLQEMRLKMDEDLEKCVIEALPVVSSLRFHAEQKKNKAGYWSIVYYSLLITISSFLITSIWKDRTSALKSGDEVTVEPHDKSFNDNVEVVEGSYFAVVQEDSEEVGSDVMYSVRTVDGESMNVRRENLRHRK